MAVTFKRIPQTSEEIKRFYRDGDFPWHDRPGLRADPLHSEKNRIILETVEKLRPAKLLEIGCGSGDLLDSLKPFISQIGVGLDISEKGNIGPSKGVFKIVGDAEALPFGGGKFDCVICSEVFEHLIDLESAICEARSVLSENGCLLVTVPNLFCMDSVEGKTRIIERTLGTANRIGKGLGLGNAFPGGWNTHIHKKTVNDWKNTYSNAGLYIIDDKPIYLFPYIPYFMTPLKKFERRLWRVSPVRRLHAAATRIPVIRKFGQLHFFLCRKS